ncbi:MAG: exodeoxyribonuclease VII large subunit [Bacillota bacterium]
MKTKSFLTVKEVNLYIKNLLEGDSLLSNLWIKGEISNFKPHSSGHFYFNLKDQSGTLKCVMFKSRSQRLKFMPVHGMQVLALGYISLYERDGQYQLYIEEMLPEGAGSLHIAYEQLKEKLTKEGLFAGEKKRKLPFLPGTIGIITSLTGAALKDMLSILRRRSPQVRVLISPAIVQGQEGVGSIVNALERMYRHNPDVIIIGRGGGSLEDLWCFNEEEVVRKISSSPIPIVSAVGHETDYTLSDFAADVRAATPSMAAEIVVPIRQELQNQLLTNASRLKNAIFKYINQEHQRVSYLTKSHILREPKRILTKYQQEADFLQNQLISLYKENYLLEKNKVSILINKLDALSPLRTLARGYAIVADITGEIIKSVQQVSSQDILIVNLSDGSLDCKVMEKKEKVYEG